ncbi:hypothetical protein ACIQNU_11340 [Streptomyces sp. NPDC091292]|uniref:hypothetical protein n=1 Tax=Streptomyces sp. NPDC091292 TaxID=3365991 RepID=UPI00382C631B
MTEPNPYGNKGAGGGAEGGGYQWGPGGTQGYGYPNQTPPPPGYGYPNSAPGYGFPPPVGAPLVPAAGGGGAPLLSLGDITVVGDQIMTPAGSLPLRGAVWNATDMSHTEERIPPHAIVLAIIFFIFCLLGLLFLLMKEKKTTGYVQVTVTSAGRHHSTMIPAHGPGAFQQVMGQLNYARSLSGM